MFYYSFVSDSVSRKRQVMENIFKQYSVSKVSQDAIYKLQKILKKKKFTKKGTERKNKIIEKLHDNDDKVTLGYSSL